MFVVIRLLPALIGAYTALAFFIQAKQAASYPWIAISSVAVFAAGGFIIAWSRHRHLGDARPIATGVVAIVCMVFGLILAEGTLATWIIPLLAGGTMLLVSELLFLSLYAPARYPVNGLSHVNLMLVPISLWLVTYASLGLTIFINTSRLIPVAALGIASFALFSSTSHAEASVLTRRRWSFIGGWMGIQSGVLVVMLPLNLIASSTLVSFVGAYALRTRRYAIPPVVPKKQIVSEALAFLLILAVILATARWI